MGNSLCGTCQTSNGFSSAEQNSIIILVVLTIIPLILCYVGVLWFAIRTRSTPEKESNVTTHNNEAFNNDVEDYDEYVQP